MKEIKVSVIVPVYNVENYLDRCIKSVVNQTLKEIEIILVDDGSYDSSGDICDKWKILDSRIKVIHKVNGGLGEARNTGIRVASGKYVGFVDSDDWIEACFYEQLYNSSQNERCDAVLGGMTDVYGAVEESTQHVLSGNVFEGNDVIKYVLSSALGCDKKGNDYGGMSVCKGIFRRETLKNYNILFYSEKKYISEDAIFDIDFYSKAKSVAIVENTGYFYVHRSSDSLTKKYDADRVEKYIFLRTEEEKLVKDFVFSNELVERIDNTFLANIRVSLMQITRYNKKDIIKNIKEVVNKREVSYIINRYDYSELPLKQKLMCILIKRKLVLGILCVCYLQQRIGKKYRYK